MTWESVEKVKGRHGGDRHSEDFSSGKIFPLEDGRVRDIIARRVGVFVCLSVNCSGVWYTCIMNEVYTLQVKPSGDHLQVTIVELQITVETGPGETSNDAALDAAHAAIDAWMLEQRSRETVKAS